MIIIDDPENTFKITEMFAFLSQDENGNEGIMGAQIGGVHFPMIGAKRATIERFRASAQEAGKLTPKGIVLVQFTHRIDLEKLK